MKPLRVSAPDVNNAQKQKSSKATRDENTHMMKKMLQARKIKGNYKNYVIISGTRLLDYHDSYVMSGKDIVFGMELIHKRDLHKHVGDDLAKLFWNKSCGIRMRKSWRKSNDSQ